MALSRNRLKKIPLKRHLCDDERGEADFQYDDLQELDELRPDLWHPNSFGQLLEELLSIRLEIAVHREL